jgi:type IV secretory pathway VirJ component
MMGLSKISGRIFMILLLTHLLLVAACGQAASPPGGTSGSTQPSPPVPPSKNLPVVELPVPDSGNDVLAIILSGDGGWADLDREFGKVFQQRGIATLGFDCLKYFWKPRQPAAVASDLETILTYYLKAWGKKRVVLIGYSFGASWLPLLVNRLPAGLQDQISLVVLLAPGSYTNIEIKITDWFRPARHPGALDVTEAAAALRRPLLCVYGTDEKDESICPQLEGKNRRIMPMPGGHHFKKNYAPIEDAILDYLR